MRTQPEDRLLGSRSKELPPKFTADERRAYVWLWDCGIRPWLVDFVTKEVTTPDAKWPGLVEFAKHNGMVST